MLGKICVQITRAPVGIKFIQNTLSFIWNPKIENKIEVDAPNTDDMKKKIGKPNQNKLEERGRSTEILHRFP